jgi:hypothetical protein
VSAREAEPAAHRASTDPVADIAEAASHLRALHEARARAELAEADALAPGSDAVAWRGALLASVVVVKGPAGPAEAAGGAAVSGPDGRAAVSALEALGHDGKSVFFTVSRPEPCVGGDARSRRVRRQIEAVDPELVFALEKGEFGAPYRPLMVV